MQAQAPPPSEFPQKCRGGSTSPARLQTIIGVRGKCVKINLQQLIKNGMCGGALACMHAECDVQGPQPLGLAPQGHRESMDTTHASRNSFHTLFLCVYNVVQLNLNMLDWI